MKKYIISVVFLMSAIAYGMGDDEPTMGFPYLYMRRDVLELRRQRLAVLQEMEQLDYVRKDLYKAIKEGTVTREYIQKDLDAIDEKIKTKNEEYENLSKKIEQVKASLSGLD